ncbi:hypothetical protein P4S63_03345 [Pseudoalteromonas sp. B193]
MQSGATSTPFNNHHDLPVMAQNPELVKAKRLQVTLMKCLNVLYLQEKVLS